MNYQTTFTGNTTNANSFQVIPRQFVPSPYPPAEDPGDPLVWLRRRVKEITDSVTLN